MGTTVSSNSDISLNEYCLKFVGKETITPNDPFWNRFLAFNISPPTTTNNQLAFESRIEPLCQELLKNNLTTGNLGSLVQVFIVRSTELLSATNSDANLFNWQIFNTLFTIRSIIKFLTEITSEEELLKHIEFKGNENTCESLIGCLVGIVVDVPVTNSTYLIHLEAVTCLIIFLSAQFHSGRGYGQSYIYQVIMKGKHIIHAPVLVKRLLQNFIDQDKISSAYGINQNHSLVIGLAFNLWSILTFRNRTADDLTVNDKNDFQEAPLAVQSLLLILILVHHWTTLGNPYRSSLFSCLNSQDDKPVLPTVASTLFKIDFELLYVALYKNGSSDAITLLLYVLLHRNSSFKSYLLTRPDLDQLIIPILRTLYNAPNSTSHHIYMSLIILLILSEDDSFNKMVHEKKLKNITWYTEKALTDISLGGILILVVIRIVQYNILKMRDKYLHTNCLAALANMSSQFRELHPYVCQRLVSIFGYLSKKYKSTNELKRDKNKKNLEVAVTVNENATELEQDLQVLEEVLRMILEILNSCLSTNLANNPNLIYTLLYNKHIFESLKDNVVFQDIIHNIVVVINHFSQLLVQKSQYEVDTHQVLIVIQQGIKSWSKEKLVKFPDLKFKYVEEDRPEDFFIPYVWALVNEHSVLHWTSDSSAVLSAVC